MIGVDAEVSAMNQEEYLEKRVQDQVDWFSRKSQRNQRSFKALQLVAILASATIPFLSGYITEAATTLKLIVGLLGLAVAAITAVLGLYKFQENWLSYRMASEALKQEKFLFLTGSEPYGGEESFKLLVERVEGLLAQENAAWNRYMRKQGGK
jgi:hypothetical protein